MLRQKFITTVLVALLVFICSPDLAQAFGMAKVTVKVVDETDKPVEAAEVKLCFFGGCLEKDIVQGVTDNTGIYSISGSSSDGVIGGSVHKEGYYYSTFGNSFTRRTLGMWQPWNKELKVLLRPMVNPVRMYVRSKKITIPIANKELGFDLIKFDWVAPYGLGTVADFIFKVETRFKNYGDCAATLTTTFSNKYDGIQSFKLDMGGDFGDGSRFRTPRHAPETGYQDKLVTRYDTSSPETYVYQTMDTYYFFRVRSEMDENGNLKRAMYGKIRGDLVARPLKDAVARLELFFWLNPDYTRNMEFDIERNLFSPLPTGERLIGIP